MVKISIIVPVFKTEKTIARCLDSLINQTMEEIEMIVIDDGSPDQAGSIVKEYQKRDSRIKLYRQENAGLGAARNTALRYAKGKYIMCVDSDDYIRNDMCEVMYETVERENAEIGVCQEENVFIDSNGKIKSMGGTKFPKTVKQVDKSTVLRWFLNFKYLSLNSVCFKIIKKDLLLDNDIWFPENYRHAEDLPTSAGAFFYAEKIAIIPENLYFYVRETSSLTYTYSEKKAQDVYLDIIDVVNYAKKTKCQIDLSNFILGMCFTALKQLYWSESKDKESMVKKNVNHLMAEKKIKPNFKNQEVPFMHKIKVLCAYFHCTKLFCIIVKRLKWIPFFKYMV